MSVDNTGDELVVTRAPIDTVKLSFQPVNAMLNSSNSTPITASTSTLYPSSAATSTLTQMFTSFISVPSNISPHRTD